MSSLNETSIIIGTTVYTVYPNGSKSIIPVKHLTIQDTEYLPLVSMGSVLEDDILITRLLQNKVKYETLYALMNNVYEALLK
jgi:hypothetical protein